jgi:hypothetical protein
MAVSATTIKGSLTRAMSAGTAIPKIRRSVALKRTRLTVLPGA